MRGRWRSTVRLALVVVSLLCAGEAVRPSSGPHTVRAAAREESALPLQQPDVVCAGCHAAIYARYERTSMARGSGVAADGFLPGNFYHAPSGVSYRVFTRDGTLWMSYSRPASDARGALQGERRLLYFVGSGVHGRTFLFRDGDAWYELPINYYRRRERWDMAPAFGEATLMPAPLPTDANCLHCHATALEAPLPEAHNRFPQRPFDQAGIGCSACHGDPSRHLAAQGHGPIVNPGKLPVAARDSACVQCHLEGDAVVYRPGRSLAQFRPGDTLSDFAVYFVRASQVAGGSRASSQYEALLQSACKRGSGDRLTCTTCHDPHSEPAPAERVAYFRARCLSCHSSPALATAHHAEQPDCAVCHMPSRSTADISHEQVTDHNIQRRPAQRSLADARVAERTLLPVGGVAAGDREFGLAYAQLAEKGDFSAAKRALALLTRAEAGGANDADIHVHLGVLQQLGGNMAGARTEYGAALRQDPFNPSALTNRAIVDAGLGDLTEALRLLGRLVDADRSQTAAGLDLAFLQCRLGQTSASRALASDLREVNPDSAELRTFLLNGSFHGQSCAIPAVAAGH